MKKILLFCQVQKPKISQILAIGNNNELGKDNQMLWHLPDDFKWFVRWTKNHPVIMGRKTMESLGKPLKNRTNIVISRNPNAMIEGFVYANSIEGAIELASKKDTEEIFVIGGGQIYKHTLELSQRIYLTNVDVEIKDADVYFSGFNKSDWNQLFLQHHPKNNRHSLAFDFCIWDRKE